MKRNQTIQLFILVLGMIVYCSAPNSPVWNAPVVIIGLLYLIKEFKDRWEWSYFDIPWL